MVVGVRRVPLRHVDVAATQRYRSAVDESFARQCIDLVSGHDEEVQVGFGSRGPPGHGTEQPDLRDP